MRAISSSLSKLAVHGGRQTAHALTGSSIEGQVSHILMKISFALHPIFIFGEWLPSNSGFRPQ
jgi:hypothetical protein